MRNIRTVLSVRSDTPLLRLACPFCVKQLVYKVSLLSNGDPPQRWDYFCCQQCKGSFKYWYLTGVLKLIEVAVVAPARKKRTPRKSGILPAM
jgi:hypothetical protein